jgi:hypothetical protein
MTEPDPTDADPSAQDDLREEIDEIDERHGLDEPEDPVEDPTAEPGAPPSGDDPMGGAAPTG